MKKNTISRTLLVAVLMIAGLRSMPADEPREGPMPGGPALEELIEKLDLTEAQREAIKPVLQSSREQRQAILAKHGIERGMAERPSFREMRALRSELEPLRKETDAKLAEILSPEQMAALETARSEARNAMKQRFKERKKSES